MASLFDRLFVVEAAYWKAVGNLRRKCTKYADNITSVKEVLFLALVCLSVSRLTRNVVDEF